MARGRSALAFVACAVAAAGCEAIAGVHERTLVEDGGRTAASSMSTSTGPAGGGTGGTINAGVGGSGGSILPGCNGPMETIEANVTEDAELNDHSPDANYGAATELQVDLASTGDQGDQVSVLKFFPLPALPAGSIVCGTKIHLYATSNTPLPLLVYAVLVPWTEATVTWNSWTTPGCGQGSCASTFTTTYACPPGSTTCPEPAFVDLDIGAGFVSAWYEDPTENRGLALKLSTPPNGLAFASKEAADPTHHPTLTITYASP